MHSPFLHEVSNAMRFVRYLVADRFRPVRNLRYLVLKRTNEGTSTKNGFANPNLGFKAGEGGHTSNLKVNGMLCTCSLLSFCRMARYLLAKAHSSEYCIKYGMSTDSSDKGQRQWRLGFAALAASGQIFSI